MTRIPSFPVACLRTIILFYTAVALGCESDPPESVASEDSELVCYDGFDNDEDDAIDCNDDGCSFATCCVGSLEASCCEATLEAFSHSWSSCPQAVADCDDDFGSFGEPEAELLAGSLVPSDSMWASGAYLLNPVDPGGSRLRIVVDAAQPDCDNCLGTIGFGIGQTTPSAFFFEDQLQLAVIIRSPGPGVEGGVINIGRVTIGRFSVSDRNFHRYALDLFPDNTAQLLEIDDAGQTINSLSARFDYPAPDPAYVVSFGRWMPPAEPPSPVTPGQIRAMAIERAVCDLPARAFAQLDPVIRHQVGTENVATMGRGLANSGEQLVLVDPVGDGFYAYRPDGSGYTLVQNDPVLTPAALGDSAITKISDPWLVADEAADRWQLYFTVWRGDAAADIGLIRGDTGFAASFDTSSFQVVAAGERPFPVLSQPTVEGDMMVVRASQASLGVFVRLAENPDGTWAPYTGGPPGSAVVLRPRFGEGTFDSEEIADPALINIDGMYRLYFAGRRGTRWAVGLAVSMAGESYRRITDDEGLWNRPAGGFSALWARDPAPIYIDGQVQMLFVGLGTSARGAVGYATSGSPTTWPLSEESTPQ